MLSDQQESFARAIASGLDAGAAASLAYPAASRNSQARQARRLIRNAALAATAREVRGRGVAPVSLSITVSVQMPPGV